jgi:hypothetical protein
MRIVARRPLLYRRGADPALDRPAHVRAASAIAWVGERLVVVQDDAAFLAIADPATGLCDDVALPAGVQGRRVFDATLGNKEHKLDLEAAFTDVDGTLIALGSGGPKPARRCAVVWRADGEPRVVAIPRLLDALAAAVLPTGTSLNLEGAALDGDRVMLANRGGDRAGEHVSPDALISLDRAALRAFLDDPDRAAVPHAKVTPCNLGLLDGAPLHFTDLAPDGLFLAAAEATDSYFDDGMVRGSVVGWLHDLRCISIRDEHGAIAPDKVEGLAPGTHPGHFYAVTDPDDPSRPGELLELRM